MLLNTTVLVDRENRPAVNQNVGLKTYFINNGEYVDPYEVCSVQIFRKSDTLSPNSVLDTTTNLVTSVPLMAFGASATLEDGRVVRCVKPTTVNLPPESYCEGSFDPSNYPLNGSITASGIYRQGVGEYVVALNNTLNLSGWDYTSNTMCAAIDVSSVGEYVDIWTVKLTAASKPQVFINNFTLSEDTFFAYTERLMLTTSNKLLNKDIRLGEAIDLKVTTEATIQNKNLPQSLINIFKDTIVTGASFQVTKINYDEPLRGSVSVTGVGSVEITSDNTMLAHWDTSTIDDEVGSKYGTYSLQATYDILNQTIISPLFYFTVS
jgi:hypothetical protein